jgi:hypothetical protein
MSRLLQNNDMEFNEVNFSHRFCIQPAVAVRDLSFCHGNRTQLGDELMAV